MSNIDLDHVILHYLRAKGHTETAASFLKQVPGLESDMALVHRLNVNKGVVEHLVTHFANDNDPKTYVDAYDGLTTWVDNSLDMFRSELTRVLYPVFIHVYLHLVFCDAYSLAAGLLTRYKRRLTDAAGRLSRTRASELNDLGAIAAKQHLETHRFATQARKSRTTIRLSPYSHELLMHHLRAKSRLLPIVNEHVAFELQDGLFKSTVEDDQGLDSSGMLDVQDGESEATNHQKINLGLLKGNLEDVYMEQLEEKRASASAAAAGLGSSAPSAMDLDHEDGPSQQAAAPGVEATPPVKKSKKAEERERAARNRELKEAGVAAKAKKKERADEGGRVEPQPWVPPLSEDTRKAWLSDIAARDPVGPGRLPSCCFFTFVNTKGSLNAVSFAKDSSRVLAGFSDSSSHETHTRPHATTGGAPMEVEEFDSDDDDSDDESSPGATAIGPCVSVLRGHTAPVHAVDFTHDQRMALSASADGTVRLWSAGALQGPLVAYKGHVVPVWDVAAAPQGYYFASASHDKTARIWCTERPNAIRILAGHQADVDVVRWHPNCHYVATASSDRTVRLWDVASGTCVRHLAGVIASPTSLAFSPDGQSIACGADDGSIAVWNLDSGRRLLSRQAHTGPVWSLCYSRGGGGALLASGGADEVVRLWSKELVSQGKSVKFAAADGAAAPTPATAATATPAGSAAPTPGRLYQSLNTYRTKSTSVQEVCFSNCNLLLAAGPFALRTPLGLRPV
ncbi:MAG: hypothetical protein WDW38_003307 [Sanguina aurantia]